MPNGLLAVVLATSFVLSQLIIAQLSVAQIRPSVEIDVWRHSKTHTHAVAAQVVRNDERSSILPVGPGKKFATISAAVEAGRNGDVIEIEAGVYFETITINKDLTLRGSGGYAHLRWGTGNYLTNSTDIPNGKGILIITGSNVFLENLEFSGAKVSEKNGAGIRYEAGNLTIRNSYFHHNENGILGQGGLGDTLVIEHTIFERNGQCLGDFGCAHNVYIGQMGKLIFRHNKSIASREGHTFKTRAHVNEIISNFFSTRSGDGSYEVDIANGGTVYFIGNIVEQGIGSGNPSMMIFGIEGVNPKPALYAINNTFYNYHHYGTFLSVAQGSPNLHIKNNIFAGRGSIGIPADRSNLYLLGSTSFVNSYRGNYRLVPNSPAINAGVNPGNAGTFNLKPQWEYVDPAKKQARRINAAIDVGAYEFSTAPTQ